METALNVGIVGAGPCGLYLAISILQRTRACRVHLFEASKHIGGRTRMSTYKGVRVVAGAGIVRERDSLLRRLARHYHVKLSPFKTAIQYADPSGEKITDTLLRLHPIDRRLTFSQNFRRILGDDAYDTFRQMTGATDYENADVCDTILDFGFEDNTPDQTMYGIDWDRLMDALLRACQRFSNFHLHLATSITSVRRLDDDQFSLNHGKWIVDTLFWTAPRPSWSVLPVPMSARWKSVLNGIACQSFLRGYATPKKKDLARAREMYPHTTYMEYTNPVQKLIPYKQDVYMVAYCDNEAADVVHRIGDADHLHEWTGIHWQKPVYFYHRCGTHYFRPLNTRLWKDRDAFLRYARHPAPGLFICGEGVSRNQGWTEGALESADAVLSVWSK